MGSSVIGGGLGFSAIGEGLDTSGGLIAAGGLVDSVVGGGLARGELSFSAAGDGLATASAPAAMGTGLEEASALVSWESCSDCSCCS